MSSRLAQLRLTKAARSSAIEATATPYADPRDGHPDLKAVVKTDYNKMADKLRGSHQTYSVIMILFPGHAAFRAGTTVWNTKFPALLDVTPPS